MVELVIRLVFSLAVVVGMLMLLTRFSAKRFRGGTNAMVRVVHRQPLSRTSAVAVVTVGSRVLVVGTTEHQVQLLTELDPDELELPAEVTQLASVPASPPVQLSVPVASAPYEAESYETAEPVPVAKPVAVAELSEFTSLDELLQPVGQPAQDVTDPAYSPRHAAPSTTVDAHAGQRVRSFSRATSSARIADGALAGSVLSAQTWKQAFAAATSRTRDAS